jgi:hypothetical protein
MEPILPFACWIPNALPILKPFTISMDVQSRKSQNLCRTKFLVNEEHACRKTRQTSLQSIISKDVMTSLLSLLTSNRGEICVQFSTDRILAKENIVYMSILWNFHRKDWWDIENFALMRTILPNPSRISVTVCYFETWTNRNRKWRVRYDRCQRRVADKTCRFLIPDASHSSPAV